MEPVFLFAIPLKEADIFSEDTGQTDLRGKNFKMCKLLTQKLITSKCTFT